MDSKIFCNNTKSGSVTLRTAITKLTLTKPSLTFNQHLTDVSVNWESNNICRHPIECQMSIDTRTCESVDAPLTVNRVLIEYQQNTCMIYQWRCLSSADRYVSQVLIEGNNWHLNADVFYSFLLSYCFFYFYICILNFFNFNWQFYIWKLFWIC